MRNRYVDPEKVLEVLLYISKSTDNLFSILKTYYFADKLHIERYGTQITGDFFVAMKEGPVPSAMYDIAKIARGDKLVLCDPRIKELELKRALKASFDDVGNTNVYPMRDPDPLFLSESNIECLDEAISKYASMPTKMLWDIVHQETSYNETELNRAISLESIMLKDIPQGKEILDYLDA